MSFMVVSIAAAVLALLVAEGFAWCPWLAAQLVRRATRVLPPHYRTRYEEEWLGELEALPAKGLSSLIFGVRILIVAPRTARALGELARVPRSKRLLDLAIGVPALLFVGPLMLVIALAIRLDSKGPVMFRQQRVGRNGRHFSIFKFRSMVTDADMYNDRLRALNEAGDDAFKIASDLRVTRVGVFLRRTSLEELPQLLNVLRGEMSLVGPRPLVVDEDTLVSGCDRSRLNVTPGITGPWEMLDTRVSMQEMLEVDRRYLANWSLWLDLKLLLRTMRRAFRRRDR